MKMRFKSEAESFHQRELFPSNIFDLLPKEHNCYLFRDLFEQLDSRELESQYSPLGQHAYHPRQIVGILIYGYTHGVFSSRQLEKRCNEDQGFMYVAGRNCPNFRVLSDFRKDNGEFFKNCFRQTVRLAVEMKLASLGHVSLDGSKFKANSSKYKAMSYKHLKEKEQKLFEEVEGLLKQAALKDAEEDARYEESNGYSLPEDLQYKQQRLKVIGEAKAALEAREGELNPGRTIDDKKQISFADHDARIMGKSGDFDYRYNAQISVDSEHQFIVGQHVSQASNDYAEVETALAQIEENTGGLPTTASLDNGYYSGANLETLEAHGVEAYVAIDRDEGVAVEGLEQSGRQLVKADFEYDEEHDRFICPGEQILVLKRCNKDGRRFYQGDAEVCGECPYRARCCHSKKDEARTITTDGHEASRRRMRDKMSSDEAKDIYRQRKHIVEPVFGQLKNSGFRGFSVRGKDKVAGEFALLCAAHNLKKIVKAALTGLVRPELGKWVAQGG